MSTLVFVDIRTHTCTHAISDVSSLPLSIEFNADCSLFAVGGVTQKIKIYDYKTVVHNSSIFSSPSMLLECQSKLRFGNTHTVLRRCSMFVSA